MKENLLDILMFLFENYAQENMELTQHQTAFKVELAQHPELALFKGLFNSSERQTLLESFLKENAALRVYLPEESEKLDTKSQGFLLFLEQIGVLDTTSRELVINHVMLIENDELDLNQLKLIILMVLFVQPEQEIASKWMEELASNQTVRTLH